MYSLTPIGYMHSCFKEKFAIPRQPLLAPAAKGVIELIPPYDRTEAIAGLEHVSHIWLLFIFHQTLTSKPRLKVRPPRLGGNQQLGVFASRSTFRPNALGQSVVKLDHIHAGRLYVSGIDLVDGTPIVDIKPYIPYADCVAEAYNHIAPLPPPRLTVTWTASIYQEALHHQQRLQQPLIALIEQCLGQDPKPAYQAIDQQRLYGVQVWDINVQWHYQDAQTLCVCQINQL